MPFASSQSKLFGFSSPRFRHHKTRHFLEIKKVSFIIADVVVLLTWSTVMANVRPRNIRLVSVKIPLISSKSFSENPEKINNLNGFITEDFKYKKCKRR